MKSTIKNILPFLSPTQLLKFFNLEPINRLQKKGKLKTGKSNKLEDLSLWEYLSTIPDKYLYASKYIDKYHNTALMIASKLVNEGLLSPVGDNHGIYQKYRGNGFDPHKEESGYYDFLIYGFSEILQYFNGAFRVLEVKDLKTQDISVGTSFAILHGRERQFLITAKHCLPANNNIKLKIFLGFGNNYSHPNYIYIHEDDTVDIAILEFSDTVLLSNKFFRLERPEMLDDILVVGFPPIPGADDAILVASKGEITAKGNTYFHKHDLIYVNANVKGGSSGSPIINSTGSVVGIIIEYASDIKNPVLRDELGFGTGLTSDLINELVSSIVEEETLHKKMPFEVMEDGSFTIK